MMSLKLSLFTHCRGGFYSTVKKDIFARISKCLSTYSVPSCALRGVFKNDSVLKIKSNSNYTNSYAKPFSVSLSLLKKKRVNSVNKNEEPSEELDIKEDEIKDEVFDNLFKESEGSLSGVSSIAVIQPWIKWGKKKRVETTPELLLDEACSLIKSLPFMQVSHKEFITLESMSRTMIFGSGNLERIKQEIHTSHSQALFISVHSLKRTQKRDLEEYFGVRVFDRYFIVLAIFKHHASTLESRLQVSLAELPCMNKDHLNDKERIVVDQREARLKATLKRIEGRREHYRKARQKSSIPSVAVVGYTNCGKTTLIRALTGDERAQGEDRLFATLDVTTHKGFLPCGIPLVFLDSVGFIQNIPTSLIASFKATLQDAIFSDVVVVVRDASHPDFVSQSDTVEKTLASLPLPKETPIVFVNNKVDLLQEPAVEELAAREQGVFSSAITGQGLDELLVHVEREVLKVTGRKMYAMRLLTGSPKITWLKEVVGISSEEMDENDPQYTIIRVVLTEAEKAGFRRAFKS